MAETLVTAVGVFPTDHVAIQAAVDAVAADDDIVKLKNKDGATFFKLEGPAIAVVPENVANDFTATAHGLANGDIVYVENTPEAAITVTADAATDKFTKTAHGLVDDDRVQFQNSGGVAPTGLITGMEHKVVSATANDFKVLRIPGDGLNPGGRPIDMTDNGTGTLTVRRGSPPGGTEAANNTIPNRIISGTPYFVVTSTANDFQLATSSGGSAVDFDDDGFGTHSVKKMGFVRVGTEAVESTKSITFQGEDVDGVKATLEGGFEPMTIVGTGKDYKLLRIRTLSGRSRCFRISRCQDLTMDACDCHAPTGRNLTIQRGSTTGDLRLAAIEIGRTDNFDRFTYTGDILVQNCEVDFEQDESLDREVIKSTSWLRDSDRANAGRRRATPGSWASIGIGLWTSTESANIFVINNTFKSMSFLGTFTDGVFGRLLYRKNLFDLGEFGVHRGGGNNAAIGADMFPRGLGEVGLVGETVMQHNKVIMNGFDQGGLFVSGAGVAFKKVFSMVQNVLMNDKAHLVRRGILLADSKSAYVGQNKMRGSYKTGILVGGDGGLTENNVLVGNNFQNATFRDFMIHLASDTENNTVIGGGLPNEVVFDQGSGNVIVGVTPMDKGVGAAIVAATPTIVDHRPIPWN